jgi:GTP-binding protein YchF
VGAFDTLTPMDLAIVGLPLSGKSTVFKALTGGHGSASAEARGEVVGVVKLPDDRLYKLAELVKAKKTTPIEVFLHDLPALFQRGAAPSGPAAETLARADALIHVVRAFDRPDVPHPSETIDPDRDIKDFDAELMLFDLGIVERRLEKLEAQMRSGKVAEREAAEREKALLARVKTVLEADKPLRDEVTNPEDVRALANFGLLSLKPMLLLLNVGEDNVADQEKTAADAQSKHGGPKTRAAAICAKLEAELTELSPEEAAEFRKDLGAPKGGTEAVLDQARELLGLLTFFTAGEKDTRAWSLPIGGTALQAAGRIHTDIERGFIRAEVIDWQKLLEFGSHNEARKKGQLRQEGKTYVVQDGDVINVLFNV